MFKGWIAMLIALFFVMGGLSLIKSADALCGRDFMYVSVCGYIPALNLSSD